MLTAKTEELGSKLFALALVRANESATEIPLWIFNQVSEVIHPIYRLDPDQVNLKTKWIQQERITARVRITPQIWIQGGISVSLNPFNLHDVLCTEDGHAALVSDPERYISMAKLQLQEHEQKYLIADFHITPVGTSDEWKVELITIATLKLTL